MSTEKGELVGITEDGIEMVYVAGFETEWAKSGMMSVADQMGKVAVALAAQRALIRTVWSARFLGQSWESSIEEMMMQLGEVPYHFPKGTLKEKS